MRKLVLIMGFPGSGKSTYTQDLVKRGYKNINRDMYDKPGKICSSKDFHWLHLQQLMLEGEEKIVEIIRILLQKVEVLQYS